MDADTSVVNERDAVALLRQVMLSMRIALDVFEDRILEISALGKDLSDAESKKAIRHLKEAFHALNRERQSFEKEFYGWSGDGLAAPIDLDAARSEIGRLLDRIRAAQGAGEISGGVE